MRGTRTDTFIGFSLVSPCDLLTTSPSALFYPLRHAWYGSQLRIVSITGLSFGSLVVLRIEEARSDRGFMLKTAEVGLCWGVLAAEDGGDT